MNKKHLHEEILWWLSAPLSCCWSISISRKGSTWNRRKMRRKLLRKHEKRGRMGGLVWVTGCDTTSVYQSCDGWPRAGPSQTPWGESGGLDNDRRLRPEAGVDAQQVRSHLNRPTCQKPQWEETGNMAPEIHIHLSIEHLRCRDSQLTWILFFFFFLLKTIPDHPWLTPPAPCPGSVSRKTPRSF